MLSYGGVNLSAPSKEILSRIEQQLDQRGVRQFVRRSYPDPRLLNLPWLGAWHDVPIRLQTYFHPVGATRFSEAYFVIDDQALAAITAAAYANNTLNALPLVMADGKRTPLTAKSVYVAGVRPLYQALLPGSATPPPGLWLLVLVDQRYFWWDTSAAITCVAGTTSWKTLFSNIATALGITLTVDPVNAAYLNPPADFATQYEHLPVSLEAACLSVGQRLVANLDGTYQTQNPLTALSVVKTNVTNQGPRAAGGQFRFNPAFTNDLWSLAPSSVSVIFPDTAGAAPTVKNNTLSSLAMPEFIPVTGNGNTHLLHSSAVATGSNGAQLTTLATQLSTDWFRWLLGFMDARLIGAGVWTVESYHDQEWSHAENDVNAVSVRIMRFPFNDVTDNFKHYGSGGSSGGTGETIDHNAVFVGTEPIINLIDNASITWTVTDVPGNQRVDVSGTVAASGSGLKLQRNTTTPVVGPEATLNAIAGTGITLAVPVDNVGNGSVDLTISAKTTETFVSYTWTFNSFTLTFDSNSTFINNGATELCGYQFWCCTTATLAAGSTNDWALPSAKTVYDITGGGGTLTGIVPPQINAAAGPAVIALTCVANAFIIAHNSNSSAAANRIFLPPTYGNSVTLNVGDSIILWYDTCTDNKWKVLSCTVDIEPAVVFPTATQGVTNPNADYTVASQSYTNATGFSITLPSSGTYRVEADVSGVVQATHLGDAINVQLWDSTNSVVLTNTQRTISYVHTSDGNPFRSQVHTHDHITVTGATTIFIQARLNDTPANFTVATLTAGESKLSYVKLF